VSIPCSPCYSRSCSHVSCMNWLTSEMALDRIAEAQMAPAVNQAT
jgi:hypothetical protein